MDDCVTRLRTLAKTCQLGTSLDEMIRGQIIEKCASNALCRRLLRERELTLDNLLPIARSFELADPQAVEIEQKFKSSTHFNSIERKRVIWRSVKTISKNLLVNGVETKGTVQRMLNVLPPTKPVNVVANHFSRVCRPTISKPKSYRENARQLEQSNDELSENECLFLTKSWQSS